MIKFDDSVNSTLHKVTQASDKLRTLFDTYRDSRLGLNENSGPDEDYYTSVADITQNCSSIINEVNADGVIDDCKGIVEKFRDAERRPGLREVARTPCFAEACRRVTRYQTELIKRREGMSETMADVVRRTACVERLCKYKDKIEKVLLLLL